MATKTIHILCACVSRCPPAIIDLMDANGRADKDHNYHKQEEWKLGTQSLTTSLQWKTRGYMSAVKRLFQKGKQKML